MSDGKHQYTVEILYHFNCGLCQGWWSYPFTPNQLEDYNMHLPADERFWCPHCGHSQTLKVKDNFLI